MRWQYTLRSGEKVQEQRDRELEDYLADAARGWRPIGDGNENDLTVTVPSGAKRVRVSWNGYGSTNANIRVRINGDTGINYTRHQFRVTPAGTFSGALDGTAGDSAFIGECVGSLLAWGEFTVFCATGDVIGYSWHRGVPGGAKYSQQFNIWDTAAQVTSLTFGVNAGSLTDFDWTAEGYFL